MKARLEPRINLQGRTALETVIPLATPFIVFVDPASACNFKCTFCPTGHRDLIADTGRFQGAMKFEVFQKIIDDLVEFDRPLKVLRLYKDGEPFLNRRLADMIAYAKRSGRVDYIDTTTNGSLISPERLGPVLAAGIDKINISVDGMTADTYRKFTGFKFDFGRFVEDVKWLYAHRGNCEIAVKIPAELIDEAERQAFFDTLATIVIASSSRISRRAGRSSTLSSIRASKSVAGSISRMWAIRIPVHTFSTATR